MERRSFDMVPCFPLSIGFVIYDRTLGTIVRTRQSVLLVAELLVVAKISQIRRNP